MNSSRRWLIVFGAVIGILIIATVSLVLTTGERQVTLLPEDTPQGTVQRYLSAVHDRDFAQAYTYLSFSPAEKIQSYSDWLRMQPQGASQATWKAALVRTTQSGENATVEIAIDILRPGGPLGSFEHYQQIVFQLSKTGDKWLITSPTYVFWIY